MFLTNRNISPKIKRSKVRDYAALINVMTVVIIDLQMIDYSCYEKISSIVIVVIMSSYGRRCIDESI